MLSYYWTLVIKPS